MIMRNRLDSLAGVLSPNEAQLSSRIDVANSIEYHLSPLARTGLLAFAPKERSPTFESTTTKNEESKF
jgi:hypothetical protein